MTASRTCHLGGCYTFGSADSSLRFIVRLNNGGTLDFDRTRLVYDSASFYRYP
jgi:hypothetical protein